MSDHHADTIPFLRNYAAAQLSYSIHGESVLARECAAIQGPRFAAIADEVERLSRTVSHQ